MKVQSPIIPYHDNLEAYEEYMKSCQKTEKELVSELHPVPMHGFNTYAVAHAMAGDLKLAPEPVQAQNWYK